MATFGDAFSGSIVLTRPGQVPQYYEKGPVKDVVLGTPVSTPCSGWASSQGSTGVTLDCGSTSGSIAFPPISCGFPQISSFNIQYVNPVKETRSMSVPASLINSSANPSPQNSNNDRFLTGECSMQRCASEKPPALNSSHYVTVPFGWRRVIANGKVLYISPSEIHLYSVQEIAIYLQTEGTCKCGLECPLIINKSFDFDPLTPTKSWNVNDFSWNDATKLCNHKRKIFAMASFQNSTCPLLPSVAPVVKKPNLAPLQPEFKKDACLTTTTTTTTGTKRKRKVGKSRSPFDGVLVSQLLAQRDKLGLKKDKPNAGSPKTGYEDVSLQPGMSQLPCQVVMHPHFDSTSQTQYPSMDENKSAFKSAMFVSSEEQNVPVFNKMNATSTYCNVSKNPNLCMMENMNFFGEDRTPHGCIPTQPQQCRPDGITSSTLLQKHMNSSCVLPNQAMQQTNENYFCNDGVPVNNLEQNFRLPLHQNIPGGTTQFLQPNGNVTLNCTGFPPQNFNNQLISTQLPANSCIDMNGYQQSPNMVASNPQTSYPGTFMFRAEVPNQAMSNNANSGMITNYMNPSYSPQFAPPYPPTNQMPSVGFNCPPRFAQQSEEVMSHMPRPKQKKVSKAKSCKLNCVLDRNSPCPNVDVRQIPSEHHRPPPEAFVTAVNQNLAHPMITGQPNLPLAIQSSNNASIAEQHNQFVNQANLMNFQQQNVQATNPLQNNGGILSKAPDPSKLSPSPFHHSPNQVNKSLRCSPLVSTSSDPGLYNQNIIRPQNPGNMGSPMMMQNNIQMNHPQANLHSSLPCVSISGNIQNAITPENSINMTLDLNSRNNSMGTMSLGTCTLYTSSSPPNYVDNLAYTMKNTNATHALQTINASNCNQSKSMLPTVSVSVSSNNFVPLNTQPGQDCQAMYYSQSNPNVLNVPFNTTTTMQNLQNNSTPHFGTINSNQPMNNCTPHLRGDVNVTQQPLVYNNQALNNCGQHQKNNGVTNFFMQSPGQATIEGMVPSRSPFVQDGSGILVQQVLSQKISDYSQNHIFQSTARAQVMQQVNGMVLPANAAAPPNPPQQVVLTQTQMRMSSPGGLITMLPPGVQTNSLMPGTQVLTAQTQQLGPQMVLPENVRPNIVSPQPQILQNNCFIMSQQPTLMARPATAIGTVSSPCLTNDHTSASNSNAGNCITLSPSRNMCDAQLLDGSLTKAQICNEIPQQLNCEELQALSHAKEHGGFTSFHLLPCTVQNPSAPKPSISDVYMDSRFPKQDPRYVTKENMKQMSRTICTTSVKPRPVPSEISPNTILTNNGQFYINSENNCMQSQSVTVSNMAQLAGMIPIVSNQPGLNTPMPPLSVPNVTAVTTTMTQMIPSIGIAPQILGQQVQPLVQVINTALPFNSMQNAVIVPGGSNVLSQTVRLDALQTSPAMGAQSSAVFNVLPPNTMNCVPAQSIPNMPPLRCHNPNIQISSMDDGKFGIIDHSCDTRSTSGSVSSCSTPASSCSSTPVPVCNEMQNATYRAQSPAVRKRGRDGKRKTNSQTVASMLQNSSHSNSLTNNSGPPAPAQQQQPAPQIASLSQQFLQPPVLQTLTVLPQQTRPLLQQPVMNYNSIGSVGGHQILTTGLASPLGIVQPLGMLGVTPSGTVIQNIPVQQVLPGTHFQSLTVLQSPQTMNPMPQEQSVVVNDNSTIGVHPSHLHSAFATGSIVPNVVTANTVISTPVGTTEVLINTSQSSAVEALSQGQSLQHQFTAALGQAISPVIQSLSPISCAPSQIPKMAEMITTCSTSIPQSTISPAYITTNNLNTCDLSSGSSATNSSVMSKPETSVEVNQNARSIGVQSGCMEQNASVQTVASSNPVSSSTFSECSKKLKLCAQELHGDHVDTKYEAENSNTLLSSGGESCESPWPDPVNLSAAVRAVVREQDDSNEDMLTNNLLNPSHCKLVSFSECTASLNEETFVEDQANNTSENGEESSNGSSVLDLRTVPMGENLEPKQMENEQSFRNEAYAIQQDDSSLLLRQEDSPSCVPGTNLNAVESASVASSDSSEQTSTDCNVTSDSGVESSQEPMNLACVRDGDMDIDKDCLSQVDEGDDTVFVSFEDAVNMDNLNCDIHKEGIKRQKMDIDLLPDDIRENSEEDTPASPPLPPQPRNFNNGDLVWGQIRGFPSWPGKLVREEEVKGTHKTVDGKLWVRWFGDHTFTQVEPDKLKTLSEGLEAHHRARKKHRRGRKMNSQLENAIQEAMTELDRQATSALAPCESQFESLLASASSSLGCEAALPVNSSDDILRTGSKVRVGRRR